MFGVLYSQSANNNKKIIIITVNLSYVHCMLSLTRLGLCPYKKSFCRAIHHSRRHPTAGRHLVQRSWSSSTAVTSSARGLDVVSPLIGLSEEQSEFYRLSKAFADRGACRLWVCDLMGDSTRALKRRTEASY